ncbi:MAG: PAS domain S-box protein [Methanosarcinales archaeon]
MDQLIVLGNELWSVVISAPVQEAIKIENTAFLLNNIFIALIILIISSGSSVLIRMHSRWNRDLEKEVKFKTKELKAVNNILALSHSVDNIEIFLSRALYPILDYTKCESGGIRLYDKETDTIPFKVFKGYSKNFYEDENTLKADECMCGAVYRGIKDHFYVNNISEFINSSDKTRDRCMHEGYEAVAIVPIKYENINFGVLHLATYKTGEVFNSKNIETLKNICNYLALGIKFRKSADALTKSEAKYRLLFEENNDAIIIANIETRAFVAANRQAQEMTGYSLDELLKLGVEDIHPKEDLEWIVEEFKKQARREVMVTHECPILRKDGGIVYADIKATASEWEGQKVLIGVFRDITERMKAEEEKKKMQEQLFQSAKLASIGELAAGVAHEVNNPLTGIINYAQLVLDNTPKNTKNYQFLEGIIEEGNRIAKIIKNLLTFARPENNIFTKIQIIDFIDKSISLMQHQLQKDGIELIKDYEKEFPTIYANGQQLQQVFINLISNARIALNEKYEGYNENKILKISADLIKKEDKSYLRVEFYDTGIGISKENLDKIFDPFFTTKRAIGGTGLGLSISYGIIKNHNGNIFVKSKEGEYTKFIIEIPIENGVSKNG